MPNLNDILDVSDIKPGSIIECGTDVSGMTRIYASGTEFTFVAIIKQGKRYSKIYVRYEDNGDLFSTYDDFFRVDGDMDKPYVGIRHPCVFDE